MAADEESFEARVKRLFGSRLFDSVPTSPFPSSSWSVAAGDVERRRWARPSADSDGGDGGDDATPCSSVFYDAGGCLAGKGRRRRRRRRSKEEFEADLDDLEDGGDNEEEERGGDGDEEIRVSIGLDPTLDREEEEDKYDREALGKEDAGDRVYMNEIMDGGPNMSIHTVVPELIDDSIEEIYRFRRDPRADHMAASARLQEDSESAKSAKKAPQSPTHIKQEPLMGSQVRKGKEDINLKPILKRKEVQDDSKPKKRVRFDSACKDDLVELAEWDEDSHMVPQSMDVAEEKENSSMQSESPGVPDYVRNPSKYTRYTLDTPDYDEEANKRAFEDFRNLVRRSDPNQMQSGIPIELPTSVTFIPRKKLGDAMAVDVCPKPSNGNSNKESATAPSFSMGIAAGASDDADQCEMEEDDHETAGHQVGVSSKMPVRRYRSNTFNDST